MRCAYVGLCLVVAAAAGPACGDDDGGGDVRDAGDLIDAMALADDASAPDAAPAERGPMRITVENLFGTPGPVGGAPIAIFAPDGALSGQTVTDEAGVATAEVEAGSTLFIGAGGPVTTSMHFYTVAIQIVDVRPGDDIHFSTADDRGSVLGSMTIDLPEYAGASNYLVESGCDAWGSSDPDAIDLTFRSACVVDGSVRVLANARSSTGGNLAYLRGSGTFANGDVLSLESAEWVPYEWATVNIAGGGQGAAQVWASVAPTIDGQSFGRAGSWGDVRSAGIGGDTLSLAMPTTDLGDARVYSMSFRSVQVVGGWQQLAYGRSIATDALDVALGEELLPWLGAGLYARADRSISWSRTGGREPDAQYVALVWFATRSSYSASALFILVPPDRSRVVVPVLPAELAAVGPPDAPHAVLVQVTAVDHDHVDGWQAARQIGFDPRHVDVPYATAVPAAVRTSFNHGDWPEAVPIP